jgi:hypothetical protein
VIVYVAESAGVTFVEPSGATAPTSGAIVNCVAFVEDQLSVVESPLLSDVGFACNVTVGRAGGGGCVGVGFCSTFFGPQPTANIATAQTVTNPIRSKGPETFFMLFLLDWHSPFISCTSIIPLALQRQNTSCHDILLFSHTAKPFAIGTAHGPHFVDQFGDSLCPVVVN